MHIKYEVTVTGAAIIELIDNLVQLSIRLNLVCPILRLLICLAAIIEPLGLILIMHVVEYTFLAINSIVVF